MLHQGIKEMLLKSQFRPFEQFTNWPHLHEPQLNHINSESRSTTEVQFSYENHQKHRRVPSAHAQSANRFSLGMAPQLSSHSQRAGDKKSLSAQSKTNRNHQQGAVATLSMRLLDFPTRLQIHLLQQNKGKVTMIAAIEAHSIHLTKDSAVVSSLCRSLSTSESSERFT